MEVLAVDQFQIEIFKQMLEMAKQLNQQVLQIANQAPTPPPNPDGNISIYA